MVTLACWIGAATLCTLAFAGRPELFALAAAMFGMPLMLADRRVAGAVDPTGLGRPVTIEDKLRADLMADKIDGIDFALKVDALPDLDAPHRPRVTARSEFQIARSEFNGTFKGKRNRAPAVCDASQEG